LTDQKRACQMNFLIECFKHTDRPRIHTELASLVKTFAPLCSLHQLPAGLFPVLWDREPLYVGRFVGPAPCQWHNVVYLVPGPAIRPARHPLELQH
jgi:hypothetical protein